MITYKHTSTVSVGLLIKSGLRYGLQSPAKQYRTQQFTFSLEIFIHYLKARRRFAEQQRKLSFSKRVNWNKRRVDDQEYSGDCPRINCLLISDNCIKFLRAVSSSIRI
ncbi:hypothetical protein NPIL_670801 [Nephila pilipes]|uniref:Uncharacterized protein n=1 Tax=Nephila pilipes TaxID=299642 RepID=A0A8X6QS67_NEPPI|nr:hypothetical protein NPIL_670801 [Nephila pilipes]